MSNKKCGYGCYGCPHSGIRDSGNSPGTQNRTCLTEQKLRAENDRLMFRMDALYKQQDDGLQRMWCLDAKLAQLNRKVDILTRELTGNATHATHQLDLEQNYALTSTGLDFSNNEGEAAIEQPPSGAPAGTPPIGLAPPRPPRWSDSTDNAAASAPMMASAAIGDSDRAPRPLGERQFHYQQHHLWQPQQQQQRTPTPTTSTYAQDHTQRIDVPPPPLQQQQQPRQQHRQHRWLLPLPPPLKLRASRRDADDASPKLWN